MSCHVMLCYVMLCFASVVLVSCHAPVFCLPCWLRVDAATRLHKPGHVFWRAAIWLLFVKLTLDKRPGLLLSEPLLDSCLRRHVDKERGAFGGIGGVLRR